MCHVNNTTNNKIAKKRRYKAGAVQGGGGPPPSKNYLPPMKFIIKHNLPPGMGGSLWQYRSVSPSCNYGHPTGPAKCKPQNRHCYRVCHTEAKQRANKQEIPSVIEFTTQLLLAVNYCCTV